MPTRDQLGYLHDLLSHALAVLRYLNLHPNEEAFLADEECLDAASMRMIRVGNAYHKLSAETLAFVPLPGDVSWQWAWGYRTRGFLAHNYEGMDVGRFYREAAERLPVIANVVNTYLSTFSIEPPSS